MIWEFSAEPRREVDVRVEYRQIQRGRTRVDLVSATQTPVILHVCKEARYLGNYKQAFSDIPLRALTFQRKYVWINPKLDIIVIGKTPVYYFKGASTCASIQRLKITITEPVPEDIEDLKLFVNLKELRINTDKVMDNLEKFSKLLDENPLSCHPRHIVFRRDKPFLTWYPYERVMRPRPRPRRSGDSHNVTQRKSRVGFASFA